MEIYRLIGKLVEQGAGVLLLSSDLPELLGLCDRVYVMHRGAIIAQRKAAELDSDTLLALASGTHHQQEPDYVH